MALKDTAQISTLSRKGVAPPGYDGATKLDPNTLAGSQLDLDGVAPPAYDGVTKLDPNALKGSQLDLDGVTPTQYLDNLPQ